MAKREDTRDFVKALEAYESKPQTQISDKVNPFRGATPAAAATPAAVAAVAAGNVDATPGGTPAVASAATDLTDDSPVVDEDGTLGDPTESGEGTSDETSDSSTDSVDSGDEVDPNADLTGEEDQPPKKGSARERIVEVLDLAEGYKEYGKLKDAENKELRARLAQATGNRQTTATATAAAPPAPEPPLEPMPDLSDEDVAYDNDKYRSKMASWLDKRDARNRKAVVAEISGTTKAQAIHDGVISKVTTFMKDHPDYKTVVMENPILAANQLGPDAGQLVAESPYTAELLYRFGKDDDLAIRIARMPPREQCKLIGRLEDEIEADKKAGKGKTPATPQGGAKTVQKKSITNAPPPPTATRSAAKPETRSVLDPSMGMEEFARQHRVNKQNSRAANRKARGLN